MGQQGKARITGLWLLLRLQPHTWMNTDTMHTTTIPELQLNPESSKGDLHWKAENSITTACISMERPAMHHKLQETIPQQWRTINWSMACGMFFSAGLVSHDLHQPLAPTLSSHCSACHPSPTAPYLHSGSAKSMCVSSFRDRPSGRHQA